MASKAEFNVSFDIYNEKVVRKLQEEDPDLLPDYAVNSAKDLAYNKQQVNSAIESAILNGKSIDKIAEDLQDRMENVNERSAIKIARTAVTSAQNNGTLDSFYEARDMGINIQKEWEATLDDRTRPSHRELDGERRELDESFSNGLQYLGDPDGNPDEIYWCRCTLVSYMPDVEIRKEDERITYKEWEKHKEEQAIEESVVGRRNQGYSSIDDNDTESIPIFSTRDFIDGMIEKKIEYRPVSKSETALTDEQIIDLIGVEDFSDGACASLALAYCDRKAGYEVKDYRGGISRDYFADNMRTWIKIDDALGAKEFEGASSYEAAIKAFASMDEDKEYLLETGRHAAIVRQNKGGNPQYLELQSKDDLGWKDVETVIDENGVVFNTLRKRFCCDESTVNEAILTDVENFKNEKLLSDILGYINN